MYNKSQKIFLVLNKSLKIKDPNKVRRMKSLFSIFDIFVDSIKQKINIENLKRTETDYNTGNYLVIYKNYSFEWVIIV